jgi:hypothetical protein
MPEEKRPAESTPMSTSSPPGGPWCRPHVQRVQSVSDAYQGPPEVVSDSGLPFETSTELLAGLPPRVSNAALLSTTGKVAPPWAGTAPMGMSPDTPLPLRAQAAAEASLSGQGAMHADAVVVHPPVVDRPIERILSERHADIRDAARVLSRDFAAQVEELKRTRPNEPDRLAEHDALVAFLEKMATGLNQLADALEQAVGAGGEPEPVLLGKAAEITRWLQRTVVEYLKESRTAVINVPVRIGLFGLGVAFVHALGIDSVIVDTLIAGLASGVHEKIGRGNQH